MRNTLLFACENEYFLFFWVILSPFARPSNAPGHQQAGPDGRRHGRSRGSSRSGHTSQAWDHWRSEQVCKKKRQYLFVFQFDAFLVSLPLFDIIPHANIKLLL